MSQNEVVADKRHRHQTARDVQAAAKLRSADALLHGLEALCQRVGVPQVVRERLAELGGLIEEARELMETDGKGTGR